MDKYGISLLLQVGPKRAKRSAQHGRWMKAAMAMGEHVQGNQGKSSGDLHVSEHGENLLSNCHE